MHLSDILAAAESDMVGRGMLKRTIVVLLPCLRITLLVIYPKAAINPRLSVLKQTHEVGVKTPILAPPVPRQWKPLIRRL